MPGLAPAKTVTARSRRGRSAGKIREASRGAICRSPGSSGSIQAASAISAAGAGAAGGAGWTYTVEVTVCPGSFDASALKRPR